MKDDFFQDEKTPLNSDQSENFSSAHDDSLDWAKQAYLQLKQKQKEEKEIKEKEILTNENIDNRIKVSTTEETNNNNNKKKSI